MSAAVRHLHGFVADTGLTREEWLQGIDLLTRVGQMSDAQRQEFILLSDTLGVSMLVEMVNHPTVAGSTEPTVFGPFHVEDAPEKKNGESILLDALESDEPLTFAGRVLDLDGNAIEGAQLEVWQTASNGLYDVQDNEQTPMNLRGVFHADVHGAYEIRTVRPKDYQIPDDGPVGEMLASSHRHNWRPAHTHFVVAAPGYQQVITHLFDSASLYLQSDPVFGVRDSLVVDMGGGRCEYDFVLNRSN